MSMFNEDWAAAQAKERAEAESNARDLFERAWDRFIKYLVLMNDTSVTERYTAREASIVLKAKGREALDLGMLLNSEDEALTDMKMANEHLKDRNWSEVATYVDRSVASMDRKLEEEGLTWQGTVSDECVPMEEATIEHEVKRGMEKLSEMLAPPVRKLSKAEIRYREIQNILK